MTDTLRDRVFEEFAPLLSQGGPGFWLEARPNVRDALRATALPGEWKHHKDGESDIHSWRGVPFEHGMPPAHCVRLRQDREVVATVTVFKRDYVE